RPEDDLPRFAPCRARRWHSGDLLFERIELEGEAEETARRAFEDRLPLGAAKGIPGTLRCAFSLAVAAEVTGRIGLHAAPIEVESVRRDVGERGWLEAEAALARPRREREAEAARARARADRAPSGAAARGPRETDPMARVTAVLAGSGATPLECRG